MLRQRRFSQIEAEQGVEPSCTAESNAAHGRSWSIAWVYLHAVAWVGAATFIIHYGEMFDVMANDDRVIRSALFFGMACSASLAAIILYIAFYAPMLEKISIDDIADQRPLAVFTGIAASVGAWLCFIIAFWPIWGAITPLLVTIIAMALLSSTNFLPSF